MSRHASARSARMLPVILILLASAAYASTLREPAALAPPDAVALVGWSRLADEFGLSQLDPAALGKLVEMMSEQEVPAEEARGVFELGLNVLKGSGALVLLPPEGSSGPSLPTLAVLVDAGEQAEPSFKALRALVERGLEGHDLSEVTAAGVALQRINSLGQELYFGRVGSVILLTHSQQAATRLVDHLKSGKPGLAQSQALLAARKGIESQPGGPTLCLYLDGPAIRKQILERLGVLTGRVPEILEALGASQLQSVYWQMQPSPLGAHATGRIRYEGEPLGVWKLWTQDPLRDADPALIPQDAYWGSVWKFDAAAAWQGGLEVAGAFDPALPAQAEFVSTFLTQFLGFSPSRDFLPTLGKTWALFDAPAHGGIYGSGAVLVIDVNNPTDLQGMLDALIERIATGVADSGATIARETAKIGQREVHYVPIAELPVPVVPSWTFVDDRWVIGLLPQTVASASAQVDPTQRKASILDNPGFKAIRGRLPKEVQSLTVTDARALYQTLYPLWTHLNAALASIDETTAAERLISLPHWSLEMDTPRFGAAVSGRDAGGIFMESYGASLSMYSASTVVLLGGMATPALLEAREKAQGAQHVMRLRGLGLAVMNYAIDNAQKFPASLAELHSGGYLPDDAFDPSTISYVAGQKMADDARNVLAYQHLKDIAPNFVVAVFLDGHVERVPLDEFKRRLRQTYERLGKPAEIPADLQP